LTPADVFRVLEGAAGPDRDFCVIGAFARNAWAPPRATTDLDFCVAPAAAFLASAQSALDSLGLSPTRIQRADPSDPLPDLIIFRAARDGGFRQVDFLVAKTDFELEVLRRALPIEISGRTVPVATPEDLLVYKLIADRLRDRDDTEAIARTQARYGRDLDWPYVERWCEEWGIRARLDVLRTRLGI